MPSFRIEKRDLVALVRYIQSIRRAAPVKARHDGDPVAGERVYAKYGCAACHRIGAAGSTLGPDLSRIGAARSFEYLRTSILDPSADIADKYASVIVVTPDGVRHRGIRVNEDSFTIQVRLQDESFASFDKQKASVIPVQSSLMPRYDLTGRDLRDVLAYLSGLCGGSSGSETLLQPAVR